MKYINIQYSNSSFRAARAERRSTNPNASRHDSRHTLTEAAGVPHGGGSGSSQEPSEAHGGSARALRAGSWQSSIAPHLWKVCPIAKCIYSLPFPKKNRHGTTEAIAVAVPDT